MRLSFFLLCLTLIPAVVRAEGPPPAAVQAPPEKLTGDQQKAADAAFKALRKLNAATEIGLSYMEYGPRLIDAKAEVDEATRVLPAGTTRDRLTSAVQLYQDARTVWDKAIRFSYWEILRDDPEVSGIVHRYHIPWAEPPGEAQEFTKLDRDMYVGVLWALATDVVEGRVDAAHPVLVVAPPTEKH